MGWDSISQEDALKYKQIAELLSRHLLILNDIAKDCESLEELQNLVKSLNDMKDNYHVNVKERKMMHFKIC